MRRTSWVARVVLGALTGCATELPQQVSVIDAPRILAVIPEPAEAAPGTAVSYRVVAGGPEGPLSAPAVSWAYCTAPKPPTEDNVVPTACVDQASALVALGAGAMVAAILPSEACRIYGPDVPSTGARPRDPDASGGYYQPVRAELAAAPLTFGLHRLRCGLADAPPALAAEFRVRYRANLHPPTLALIVGDGGGVVAPGAVVEVRASWPAEAAERYVVYDRVGAAIVERREALRVAWFVTGGALAADATGVGAEDPATATAITWTAPSAPGPIHLWAVLTDARGGVATATVAVEVR